MLDDLGEHELTPMRVGAALVIACVTCRYDVFAGAWVVGCGKQMFDRYTIGRQGIPQVGKVR